MKKRFDLSAVIALALLVAAVTYILTLFAQREEFNNKIKYIQQIEQEMAKYVKAKQLIDKNFVGDFDPKAIEDASIAGLVSGLGDRWSSYLSAEQYAVFLEESENKYVGIGIETGRDDTTGGLLVLDVFKGSPAETAGIRPLDIITAINGKRTADIGYSEAVASVKGLEDTSVSLTVMGADQKARDLSITRKPINRETVQSEMLDNNIGYVRIINFNKGVSAEFELDVTSLINAGARGLIFDLRFNPGGSIKELIPMLDMILPEGQLFMSRDKNGKEEKFESDERCLKMPMAVIVHKQSYSAAEFFAAALQEYGWAKIVGESTYGKGFAQVTIELGDGSALLLSTHKYFTPKGINLNGVGIKPDFEVAMSEDHFRNFSSLPHAEDEMLQKALEVVGSELPAATAPPSPSPGT